MSRKTEKKIGQDEEGNDFSDEETFGLGSSGQQLVSYERNLPLTGPFISYPISPPILREQRITLDPGSSIVELPPVDMEISPEENLSAQVSFPWSPSSSFRENRPEHWQSYVTHETSKDISTESKRETRSSTRLRDVFMKMRTSESEVPSVFGSMPNPIESMIPRRIQPIRECRKKDTYMEIFTKAQQGRLLPVERTIHCISQDSHKAFPSYEVTRSHTTSLSPPAVPMKKKKISKKLSSDAKNSSESEIEDNKYKQITVKSKRRYQHSSEESEPEDPEWKPRSQKINTQREPRRIRSEKNKDVSKKEHIVSKKHKHDERLTSPITTISVGINDSDDEINSRKKASKKEYIVSKKHEHDELLTSPITTISVGINDSDDEIISHPARVISNKKGKFLSKLKCLSGQKSDSETDDPDWKLKQVSARRHARQQQTYKESHPEYDVSHARNELEYHRRHPVDQTLPERQRLYVQRYRDFQIPHDDGLHLENPKIVPAHYLGLRNNMCVHCHAVQHSGELRCCNRGKVFLPPLKKLPEPLNRLLLGPRGRGHTATNKFLKEILQYNGSFAMASTRYTRIPPARFGAQIAKVRGAVHHYPSAVLPNPQRNPAFGNLYVYCGEAATDLRMANPLAMNLDRAIMLELQLMMESVNPHQEIYWNMGQMLEKMKTEGKDPDVLRMKIVNARKVDPSTLRGHPAIYGEPKRIGDYLAVFYSCTVEQEMNLPGLIVYPRRTFHHPRPIFYWSDLIDSLCYPLLFPYGEAGWSPAAYPYCKERKIFTRRLREYATEHPNEAGEWEFPTAPRSFRRTEDPNIEESDEQSDDSEEDHNRDELEYEAQLNEVDMTAEQTTEELPIVFEERGGEQYPLQVRATVIQQQEAVDSDDEEYIFNDVGAGDEPPVTLTMNDLVSQQANENPSTTIEDEATEEHQIREPKHRTHASQREALLYRRRTVKGVPNRFTMSGKLGQLHLIDSWLRIQQARSDFIRKHHTQYLTSNRKKFLEAIQRRIDERGGRRKIGYMTIIPASVPGSPRYLQRKYENALTLSNKLGPADLFITFTANVNWKEIKENLLPGQTWADNPELVCEVFHKKQHQFLDVVLGKKMDQHHILRAPGLMGSVKWWTYSIEFQQRGPPHMHLLVSLVDHVRNVAEIDKICQATFPKLPEVDDPEYEDIARLRKLIKDLMVHRPCENDPNAYCRENQKAHWKQCTKHFPKVFSDETMWGDSTYPILRRPADGEIEMIRGEHGELLVADNTHIVPTNIQLLSEFESHINVEICANLGTNKYIFKYLYKGNDRALMETITSNNNEIGMGQLTLSGHVMFPTKLNLTQDVIEAQNLEAKRRLIENKCPTTDEDGNPVLVMDETHYVEDLAAMTACEGAWHTLGYERTGCSHEVATVFIHGPKEEPITYQPEEEEEVQEKIESGDIYSRLTGWFELNRRDPEAHEFTFDELPLHYIWKGKYWAKRKRNKENILGRIKSVHPRNTECYAIRLLTQNRKNITSFKDLRTIDGEELSTFVDAAKRMRLMNDQQEWDNCLEEAAQDKMPVYLRRLFASMLLYCVVLNPLELWEKYKEQFYEHRPNWSQERLEAHALYHIRSILLHHSTTLEQFYLPDINESVLPPREELSDDGSITMVNLKEAESLYQTYYQEMNDEQRHVFDGIVASVQRKDGQSFFIDGSAGTGKTFIYRALYYYFVTMRYKVLCVAHTGIAATLLPYGRTSHSAFKIPLELSEDINCIIPLEDDLAAELATINVVLWDEACMSDKRILEAVNRFMWAIHPEDAPPDAIHFGGVPFIFGGDWKQTLPIVTGTRGPGVLNYTIIRSQLWKDLKVFHLTKNMRAAQDPEYADFVLKIGEGRNIDTSLPEQSQKAHLPDKILLPTEQSIIDFVFGNGQLTDPDCCDHAILTVDNATALELNEKILKMMPGEEKVYLSVDTADESYGFTSLDPESYNSITPPGLPRHKLTLKVGAIVVLLSNMSVRLGLCNGTRMRILEMKKDILICEPLLKTASTTRRVYIHRKDMKSTETNRSRETAFIRHQFPIRLAMAMTVNKGQGQTLKKVGLILRTPCFAHGQLYTAVTRVRAFDYIRIFNCAENKNETTNVVHRSIFHSPP